MLLVEIEKYRVGLFCFGPKNLTTDRFSQYNNRLVSEAHCEMRRFEQLPKMHGDSFEYFEFAGMKFTRYLSVSYRFVAEEQDPPTRTIADLIIWYKNHKVATPFEEWMKTIPFFGKNRGRQHITLLTADNGEIYLFYIENGTLHHQWISETSFIYNGFVTSLAEAKAKRLKAAEKVFAEVQEHLDKLVPDTFDLPRKLDGSDVLNYVNDR